ncbi:BTAD domain-containing putative transcriptional regulator [Ruegeria arenilitoris]|uniref:BTAD domain-containing putative transcriptional regulator n=1 Tax=Ruegeria arenilitoris TaxID=1173585 RepID=UPI001481BA47|nr:BTAD domain-containing putative transcriptional regulator [Ruegeria arenilitoris]
MTETYGDRLGEGATSALNLLGAFELNVHGQAAKVSSRKGQLLLARLATERGRTMTRQQLAAFLWPDHGSAQARASLRQALSRLRDVMGPAASLLQSDVASVWLDDARMEYDLDSLSVDLPVALLCRLGEFLEGVHVGDPTLQEWLEAQRRHQSERLITTLATRAEAEAKDGNHENVIRLALRQITLDPLNEAAHRRLMEAFSNSRRSSRAMEQYQTLQALLRGELDVAPEKETTELYHRIRNERAQIPRDDNTTPPETQVEDTFPTMRLVTVLCLRLDARKDTVESLTTIVKGFGGEKLHATANDLCFLFGLETSREDDALHALEAASQAISELPDLAAGMALGLVTRDGGNIHGEPLRRAEALSFMAAPGEVLSGSFLRNQTRGWAEFVEEDFRGKKFWRLVSVERGPLRPRLPFVGRKIELLQLGILQDEAMDGRGSVSILAGNAGMGKTRLTEELESRTKEVGGLVLRMEFNPTTGNKDPLRSRIATRLAGLLNLRSPEDLHVAEADRNPFLFTLFDNHRSNLSGIGPSVLSGMAVDAICAMLDYVPETGLTMVLDDCHWATSEEIAFLALLSSRLYLYRVFVVATERANEERLRPVLQAQSMETPVHVTMLSPLRKSEAMALARTVSVYAEEDATRIVEHAAGNPLFTIRLTEASNELGDTIPNSVIALAQLQLDRLDEQIRHLCQNAAVLGRSFPRSDAAQIFGPAFASEVLTSGFLNTRGSQIEFDHALIQQAIYEATPDQQRRAAHTAAAMHYMSRDAFKWAEHAVASGDAEQATTASVAAAIEAVAQNRFTVAERFVTSGLSSACTGDNKAELQRSLADIRRDQGQIDEAIALYREATDTAESASARLRALVGQAWMLRFQGAIDEANTAFAKAERLTTTHDISDLSRCDFLTELGNRAFIAGDAQAAFSAHSEGLLLARQGGHDTQIARSLGGLGDAHYAAFELISARERFRECVAFAEQNNLGMVANAHRHMLSYTSFFVDPGDEAMSLATVAIERAVAEGNARNEFAARVDFLDYLVLDRNFDGFEEQLKAISALLDRIGENRFQSDIDGAKCTRALLLGDKETLGEISGRYVRERPTPYMWPAFAALHACSLDDRDERMSWLERGEALFAQASMSHALIFFHHFAAQATRDMPDVAISYAHKLRERSGAELTGFAELSIRTTLLRAEANPDQTEVAVLRKDLTAAHLSGFWPELFDE